VNSGFLNVRARKINVEDQMRLSKIGLLAVFLAVIFPQLLAYPTDKKPKITMEQARATAVAKAPGDVKSAELEREHGKLVYSFDIKTTSGVREIQVDANTGVIVSDQVESAADEAREASKERSKSAPKK
jgi:uncharacterized membrane protein YkoI